MSFLASAIARKRLARLGVAPTPRQLRLHLQVGSGDVDGDTGFLADVDGWLDTLRRANETMALYPADAFARVLAGH